MAGYLMKFEAFIPFDPKDPVSVATASKFAASESLRITDGNGFIAATIISSRMVMKRKAATVEHAAPTPGEALNERFGVAPEVEPGQMPAFLERK